MKVLCKQYKELIPIVAMIGMCIYSLIRQYFQHWSSGLHLLGHGFILVTICTMLFFTYRPLYKYLLALTVCLALMGLIRFEPRIDILYTYLESYGFCVGVQPTALFLALLVIVVYFPNIKAWRSFTSGYDKFDEKRLIRRDPK